jgi:hypothetical protein
MVAPEIESIEVKKNEAGGGSSMFGPERGGWWKNQFPAGLASPSAVSGKPAELYPPVGSGRREENGGRVLPLVSFPIGSDKPIRDGLPVVTSQFCGALRWKPHSAAVASRRHRRSAATIPRFSQQSRCHPAMYSCCRSVLGTAVAEFFLPTDWIERTLLTPTRPNYAESRVVRTTGETDCQFALESSPP